MIGQITRAGQYSLAWGEVSGKKHTSAYGTLRTSTLTLNVSLKRGKADTLIHNARSAYDP